MISRRRFLAGTGTVASAALLARIANSETRKAPLRFLFVHKPAGTSPAHYDTADLAALGPVLAPFAAMRDQMVIVDGLENRKQANTPGEDHANGITTFLTGGIPFRPNGSAIALTERASIDQLLAANPRIVGTAPIRSLQLTADDRGHQFLLRVISHAGHGMPLPPEESPLVAFARVFGTLTDRELTPEEAAKLRARKQSVLDFTRDDLVRLQSQFGAAEKRRIDRHFTAIREVERIVQNVAAIDPLPLQRRMEAATRARDESRDRAHGEIGRAHFELVRVAFQCDLTRIASFTWGAWGTNVAAYVPGVEGRTHHDLSHSGKFDQEAAVHRWYNEQLAVLLQSLRDTPDVDGRTLLDNTLVVAWTEMRLGNHSFDNTPIALFGGASGRLAGGRIARYPGYSTNDLWRSMLNALGDSTTAFGDDNKNSGRIAGLFTDVPIDTLAP